MSDYRDGVGRLPEHMRASMTDWIETARIQPELMGSFMRSVLTNDLMGAYGNADEENTAAMREWVRFLYNEAPSDCYGSMEKLRMWHERGGLQGKS